MSYYKKQEQEGNNRLHGVVEPQQSVVTTTAFPLRAKKTSVGNPAQNLYGAPVCHRMND